MKKKKKCLPLFNKKPPLYGGPASKQQNLLERSPFDVWSLAHHIKVFFY